MQRLLLVSNRLPITLEKKKEGISVRQSVGGLATGLSGFYTSHDCMWIGWCGIPSDGAGSTLKKDIEARLTNEFKSYPVFLSKKDIRLYYHGFSNKTIWPLFHHFTECGVYSKNLWESYKRVNKLFCNAVMKVAKPGDTIWIHDYHLMLLPQLIREKMPDASIGFFLHIPFPSYEVFRLLPWRKEILEGLLGADLIGFHTYDYTHHFLSSVRRLAGYEYTVGQISVGSRVVKADAFPMGIDYQRFAGAAHDPEVKRIISRTRNKTGERRIVLSVDRLDYTKGILERLEAFDLFLEKNPEYKEKVTLILVAVPSRTAVETYAQLKKNLDELVGRMNGKYGTIGWIPVWYLYRFLPFHTLTAYYCVSDVALVTPKRDGMNLIAKEYVAAKQSGKGVLVLSEMAGAAVEMGEAIIVNPNNTEEVARALKDALTMPEKEQIARNRAMQKRLERYNVMQWATDFMDRLALIKRVQWQLYARRLTCETKTNLLEHYGKSDRRLLLFDYDGTLVPFAGKPEKAKPDAVLLGLLKRVAEDSKNEVVIISGRDKDILDKWFQGFNVGLVAEHGVWIKEKGSDWRTMKPLRADWKDDIRPILELYVDRTPGSFVEEKDYSLVWHYRNTNPDLASVRVSELKDALLHMTENLDLGVMDGNKVIEIKSAGINKGMAALQWVAKQTWDFVLAVGDDVTDEHIFAILPQSAYSIKVGLDPSRAKFNLDSVADVRSFLRKLRG